MKKQLEEMGTSLRPKACSGCPLRALGVIELGYPEESLEQIREFAVPSGGELWRQSDEVSML